MLKSAEFLSEALTFIQNQIRSVNFSQVVLLLVLLYSHISFGLTSILTWISPRIFSFLRLINFTIQKIASSLNRHTAQKCFSLPWGLFLLPPGASLLHLSARRFSLCCSRYLPQTGSSRDPRRPETDLKAGQSLPCEGMHYFDSLRFHFQQTEGRFLFLTH